MERTELDATVVDPDALSALTWLRLTGVERAEELVELVRAERAAHPGVQVLCTLDSIGQAAYTHEHALEDERLDPAYADDAPDLADFDDEDAEQARAYELAVVEHIVDQLHSPAHASSWADLAGSRPTDPEEVDAIARVNLDPGLVVDHEVQVLLVPAGTPADAIAGLANGYFPGDWDTFENHAVASHLADRYGFRLFAIGASWLGFERDGALDAAQAKRLTDELAVLYDVADAPAWTKVAAAVTERETLFLPYTESIEID
ncbi:hypothetical protein [Nocardioides sp. GXZ039]|uniref:hypothetical protein n=1 Tax=Nocardioides sp. GXZ039 TaxID=3136018 RepID=UPI0030F467E5